MTEPTNSSPTTDAHEGIAFCIITCTYNAAAQLPRTLDSVRRQTYRNIHHLIVDGQSSDDTLGLLEAYREQCSLTGSHHTITIVSEPDGGLYDAMNKAIRLATGDYLVFLNAGDALTDDTTIERMAHQLLAHGSDYRPSVLYGDTNIIDDHGTIMGLRRLRPPSHLTWRSFRKGMLVCHQAFYARTDLARQTPYDLHYRFSADVDWCIRIMRLGEQQGLPTHDTRLILCNYLDGGMTTKNHRRSLMERFSVMRRHYGLLPTIIAHITFFARNVRVR